MRTDDIVKKKFARAFVGYDMQEVDEFLDDVIDKIDRMEDERREILVAMEYLLKKLEKTGALEEARRKSSARLPLPAPESNEKAPARKKGKLKRVQGESESVGAGESRSEGEAMLAPPAAAQPVEDVSALDVMTGAETPAAVAEEMETGITDMQMDAFIPELLEELSEVFPDSDIARPGKGSRGKRGAV